MAPTDLPDIAEELDRVNRAADVLSKEEIASLRRKSPLKTWAMIAHCWGTIFAVWVVCCIWPHPLLIALGVMLVGCRQLGLGIVNHEAAHYLLFDDKRLNDWVARWLVNRPMFGQSVDGYRKYHIKHHQNTQQVDDPDLVLSAPFPVTRSSFHRKVWRDLSGQTGWKQRSALVRSHWKPADASTMRKLTRVLRRFGPNLAINAVFLAGFTLAGHWYLSSSSGSCRPSPGNAHLRIRNIAEHAVVPDDDDRPQHLHDARGLADRALIAPYWVNYHLGTICSCPCPAQPATDASDAARQGPGPAHELGSSYAEVLGLATSKPDPIAA